MKRARLALSLAGQLVLALSAQAHELRPAYLEMRETVPETFSVLWRVPARGDLRLALDVRLPASCHTLAEPTRSGELDTFVDRWTTVCAGGLAGQAIAIEGLQSTMTDVLARLEYRNGAVELVRLTPETPRVALAGVQSVWQVARTFFMLGVEHILTGYDHLLFVLVMILLIRDRWVLVKTVTAFTLAHSITLAGASLGYFSLPQKPVEAAIALSIAFLAAELIKARPRDHSLVKSYPWVVAFLFGLLHGFGFAGALRETGLPHTDLPLALATFNLGVEAGQLLFIAAALAAIRMLGAVVVVPTRPARLTTAYLIGTISMVWVIERLGNFAA
jgi:hydrogenase/urease accessory protein HupE